MSEARIEGNDIVIRIPIDSLPQVVEGSWAIGYMSTRYDVTEPSIFAKALVHELNYEDEQGTTPVHKLFDSMIEEAINQGAEGIEEHPDQEDS